ncbi:hypothetical protein Tco_0190437 [Tanacetum coccineum]
MGCDNMSYDNNDLNIVHDVTSTLLAAGVSQQDVDAQGKYGFQKVISDDDVVFYFQFTSVTGMEQVMEKGKHIMLDAFTSSMCSDPWGRMGFTRAMIEVSAENELKKEVTMVVPNVDGEGHTKQIMSLKFEWKPPQCCECHVFGHSISSCPKCVVVNNAKKIVENDDSFTVVTYKKNKGKKVTNNNDANNGFKLPKPKPKVWGKKNVIQSVKPKENQVPVSLKNTFSILNDLYDPVALKEMESHVDINALSTVCSKVFRDWDWTSNANLCNKGCRIIVGWDAQVVDLLVLAQMDQVLHTKDLDLHKNMVRGKSWVLMGDFNVALNLEDIFSGSSVMNASMIEFKDCVANI